MPHPSTGALITDIDFVLTKNGTKKACLIEKKALNAPNKPWQDQLIADLQEGLKRAGWSVGSHLIQFENTTFENGKVYLDFRESSEEEIRKTLTPYCS